MVRYALVAILWLCPSLAAAQNVSDTKAAADALFNEGKSRLAAGDINNACSKFERSLQLIDRLGVRLNLADCHEQQGRTATAWTEFREAASQADKSGDDRAAFARQRADALAPRLAKLEISVPPASQLPGLAVQRDGVAVPNEKFAQPIPVDPGSYTVEASAPGCLPWSTHADVSKPGQIVTVEVPLLAAAPAKVEPSNSPATSLASPQTSSKAVPLLVGTGAFALLGGGLGFELWAESRYAAAKSEMTSQPRRDSLYNSAINKRYAAAAFAVSGVAAGGVAVWLYLRGDNRERDVTTKASLHVVPTATGLVLSGQL